MKIIGVDPSSSCSGVALLNNDKLISTKAWVKPKFSAPERLVDYHKWLDSVVKLWNPDVACIEFLSVERNAQSTRVVAFYQAISALVCKQNNLTVVEGRVRSARKIVFGNGALSKKECFELVKKKYPDHIFGRFDASGADETDATVLALAWSGLVEKK